jgi:hypothetical protein
MSGTMLRAALALLLGGGGAEARDLEQILREKGVLTAEEASEARKEDPSVERKAPEVPGWVSRITPSGDLRIRGEGFRRDGDDSRERFRLRFRIGARVAVNEETELGFRLASGSPNNPVSTNQTFTDTFIFKNFNLNTAYLKLAPAASLGLDRPIVVFVGGKFENPFVRFSETVFDSDLTPEGFQETLNLVENANGLLRAISLQAGQWNAEEVSAGSDAWVFGGQGSTKLRLSDGLGLSLAISDYGFREVDLLAAERNTNGDLAITNDVRLSDGTIVGGRRLDPTKLGPNGDGRDAEGNPLRIEGFAGDFNVVSFAGQVDVDTGLPRWPAALTAEYALNTEAEGDEDTAFWIGGSIGASKRPGEVSVSYAYARKETNSVVSSLTYDDLGPDGGTNVEGHVVGLAVGILDGLKGATTLFVTEPVENVVGANANTSYRFQVDLIASF